MRKIQRRTPSGRVVTHFERKRPKKAHCGRCKKILSGVESNIPSKMRKLSKSEKIPSRKYAGVLCANCLEELLRYKVRFEAKFYHPEEFKYLEFARDLTIEKFLPRGWWTSFQDLQKTK